MIPSNNKQTNKILPIKERGLFNNVLIRMAMRNKDLIHNYVAHVSNKPKSSLFNSHKTVQLIDHLSFKAFVYYRIIPIKKKKNITALLQGLELRSLTHLSLFCYCFAACRFQTPKDITNLHIFISGIKYSNPRSTLVVNQT